MDIVRNIVLHTGESFSLLSRINITELPGIHITECFTFMLAFTCTARISRPFQATFCRSTSRYEAAWHTCACRTMPRTAFSAFNFTKRRNNYALDSCTDPLSPDVDQHCQPHAICSIQTSAVSLGSCVFTSKRACHTCTVASNNHNYHEGTTCDSEISRPLANNAWCFGLCICIRVVKSHPWVPRYT